LDTAVEVGNGVAAVTVTGVDPVLLAAAVPSLLPPPQAERNEKARAIVTAELVFKVLIRDMGPSFGDGSSPPGREQSSNRCRREDDRAVLSVGAMPATPLSIGLE